MTGNRVEIYRKINIGPSTVGTRTVNFFFDMSTWFVILNSSGTHMVKGKQKISRQRKHEVDPIRVFNVGSSLWVGKHGFINTNFNLCGKHSINSFQTFSCNYKGPHDCNFVAHFGARYPLHAKIEYKMVWWYDCCMFFLFFFFFGKKRKKTCFKCKMPQLFTYRIRQS